MTTSTLYQVWQGRVGNLSHVNDYSDYASAKAEADTLWAGHTAVENDNPAFEVKVTRHTTTIVDNDVIVYQAGIIV